MELEQERGKKKLYARTSILICINPHSSTGMILLNAVERRGNTVFSLFKEWVDVRMQDALIQNKVNQT